MKRGPYRPRHSMRARILAMLARSPGRSIRRPRGVAARTWSDNARRLGLNYDRYYRLWLPSAMTYRFLQEVTA